MVIHGRAERRENYCELSNGIDQGAERTLRAIDIFTAEVLLLSMP